MRDNKLAKLLSEPKILRGLRVELIGGIIDSMPIVYLDFLGLNDNAKTMDNILSELRRWVNECIKQGLPFAHSLHKNYLDPLNLSEAMLDVLAEDHSTQQWQMLQHANRRLLRVVQARTEGRKSDELAEHARKLQVTLADDHWELTVPSAGEGGTTRLRMIIALVSWQAFFALEAGELPKLCRADDCGNWFVRYKSGSEQQFCSGKCRKLAWNQKEKRNRTLDTQLKLVKCLSDVV